MIVVVVLDVQSLSHVQLFGTPWTAAHQAPLSFTVSQSLLKFMSARAHVVGVDPRLERQGSAGKTGSSGMD